MKKRAVFAIGLVICIGVAVYCLNFFTTKSSSRPAISVDSGQLKHTRIIAVPSMPLEDGKNVIWCASFQAAWRTLQKDVAKGPVKLEGADKLCAFLNQADEVKGLVPEGSLYTKAGRVRDGVIETIRSDVDKMLPGKEPPSFPATSPDDCIAYAYLESHVSFDIPYFQNREPLMFRDAQGRETAVRSFGIRRDDGGECQQLRRQLNLLYATTDSNFKITECAIDLDTRSPVQVVVAMAKRRSTLEETLASLEKKISASATLSNVYGFNDRDILLIPDIPWHISHHFTEFEGRSFVNDRLQGYSLAEARQDMEFQLDHRGAGLKVEASMFAVMCVPAAYIFDRPFLVYMKRRGVEKPFFAMWVDNAELLRPWKS